MIDDLYNEMRRLAQAMMRGQHAGHTLQATALVNEAFLRLGDRVSQFTSVEHAKAVFATAMRHELIDHVRRHGRRRRGGSRLQVRLDDVQVAGAPQARGFDVVDLDDALIKLAQIDEKQARVAELRLFGEMAVPEIAEALMLSETTVKRLWRLAKSWLRDLLQAEGPECNGHP